MAERLMAAEPASGDREERVRRKDGQFVWVRLTISPIRSSSGESRHLIVILEAVSERRRLEERLRESEKLEAIGRLAAMTRVILERAGYHVVEAAAPDEAQNIFRSRASEIDLMISDVVMPGSHGPALFKKLSAEHPSLRVLYMSGYTDNEIIHSGRLEGGENFLEKPFTSQKLLEKVREILDG
jgi:CheY-like chemotaxis protein